MSRKCGAIIGFAFGLSVISWLFCINVVHKYDLAAMEFTGVDPNDPGFRQAGTTAIPISHDTIRLFFNDPFSGLSTCGQIERQTFSEPTDALHDEMVDPAFIDPVIQTRFRLIRSVCRSQGTIFCSENNRGIVPIGPGTITSIDGVCRLITAGHLFYREASAGEQAQTRSIQTVGGPTQFTPRILDSCFLDFASQEISTLERAVPLMMALRGLGRPIRGLPSNRAVVALPDLSYGHSPGASQAKLFELGSSTGYLDYAWWRLDNQHCQNSPPYTSDEIRVARRTPGPTIQSTSIRGVEFIDYNSAEYSAALGPTVISVNGREARNRFPSFPGTSGGFVWRMMPDGKTVPFFMVTGERGIEGLISQQQPGAPSWFGAMQSADDETFGMIPEALFAPPPANSN